MTEPIGPRYPRYGLAWVADDPAAVAVRLAAAIGSDVPIARMIAIAGLALVVRGPSAGEAIDRLTVVDRGDEPVEIWLAEGAVGWATVDVERAMDELIEARVVGSADGATEPIEPLGASARRAGRSAFGVPLLLLEPATEGRLAATLARHGEGPCAIVVGTAADGEARLVLGGAPSGPHLLVHGGGYHRPR